MKSNDYIPVDSDTAPHFEAPNMTGTPERRLLLAILERAILDFVGNDTREVVEAEEWLFNEPKNGTTEPYSFRWVCESLDLDFDNISDVIAKMPKRGSHRIAPWYLTKNYGVKNSNELPQANAARARRTAANSESTNLMRKAS